MSWRQLPGPPELKAVLLDAGNTLVFLDHQAVALTAQEEDESLTAADIARAEPLAKRRYEELLRDGASHELGWDLFMAELLRQAGAREERLDALVSAQRRVHDAFNLWRAVPEELPNALKQLRAAGLRLGVVSNSEGQLDALFERVGLSPLLDVVVDSALEGVRKPDPALFERALERVGCAPEQAIYVGDIPAVDVVGARAAGIAAVLIDTAGHYPGYTEAPVVGSVAELVSRIL